MARPRTQKRSYSIQDQSSDEDAPRKPKRRKTDEDDWKPQRKSNTSAKGRRRRDVSDAADYMNTASELVQTNPHPVSLHVISRPEPLREALLNWYDQVHALRGMPWRKPFNSAWDAEQKAQRAYEVDDLPNEDLHV